MTSQTDWDRSAQSWINHLGSQGDWGRQHIIDPALNRLMDAIPLTRVLDVGCGEGRVCRMLKARSIDYVGIDPTKALIEQARQLDADGDYQIAGAQDLPFEPAAFDGVISCLSLIDIPDAGKAIAEMARVLRPSGKLIVINLTSFNTAGTDIGWIRNWRGQKRHWPVDNYLQVRGNKVSFSGVEVVNWHRPLGWYMTHYLNNGLVLKTFEEPTPDNITSERADYYSRAPWFNLMVWQRPD